MYKPAMSSRHVQYDPMPALLAIPEDDQEYGSRHVTLVSPLHESLAGAVMNQVSGHDLYGRRGRRRGQRYALSDRPVVCCVIATAIAGAVVFLMWFYLFREGGLKAWK